MKTERAMPPLKWSAIVGGTLFALLLGLSLLSLAALIGAPALGLTAPVIGCAGGAFFSGKQAKRAGAYHGAMVGMGWIVLEAFGLVPAVTGGGLTGAEETIAIIVIDILLLAVATASGWIATRDRS